MDELYEESGFVQAGITAYGGGSRRQTMALFEYSQDDLNYQTIYNAYCALSHSPDVRARDERTTYFNHMQAVDTQFQRYVDKGANSELVSEALASYKAGYLKRYHAYIAAKSRCMSAMIVGRARFPVARNEKRFETERKRSTELVEWSNKILTKLKRQFDPVVIAAAPIRSGDSGAIEELQAKLEDLQAKQVWMKAVNAAMRLSDDEAKVQALIALRPYKENRFTEVKARKYVGGRFGFEGFELANNNARINSVKVRIEALKAEKERQAAPAPDKVYDSIKVRIVENVDLNRVQVVFDRRTTKDVYTKMRHFGFVWSRTEGAFQRMLSNNGRFYAQRVCDELLTMPKIYEVG